MSDLPKVLSIQERKKRNEELKQKSEARLKARGAPFFGATEKDILDLKIQMPQITQSINSNTKDIHKIAEDISKLSDLIQEQKILNQALRDLLTQKGIIAPNEIAESVEAKQLTSLGLRKKEGIEEVENGDHVLIKFKIFHDGKLIDDQTSGLMAYAVGSYQIPIDEQLLGMKEKDTKRFSMISTFKNPKLAEFYEKEVEMEIFVSKILQKV